MTPIYRTNPRTFAKFGTSRGKEYLETKRALALRRWFVALAGAASAPADIMTLTDSIIEGHNLTSYLKRIPYKALTRVRATYQPAGIPGGLGYIAPYMATGQCADWPVVNTGGSTSTLGLGSRSRFMNSAGNKSVFSFTGATHIGVLYNRAGSSGGVGHFTYQIDAGSTTDVDVKLSTASDFIEILLTIPDTGAHTVTVAWVSGAIIFDGFMHYNGDSGASGGIRLWEGGHGGGATSTFMGSGALIGYLGNHAAKIQPSLLIIELFANDFIGASPISAATALSNLNTIISTVRANTTTAPSIVLIPVWELGSASVTPVDPWSTFVNNVYTLADGDAAICVLDFQQRVKTSLGSGDTGRGILSVAEGTYPAHPVDVGAAYLGEVLARFISPL